MKTPELSIIVISYNTKDITHKCLTSIVDSLAGSRIEYEIIVVDNDSKDESVDMLEKFAAANDNVSVIRNKENVGFGTANNQAVKKAQGEYVLFLNSDIEVKDNAITTLFNFFRKNEERYAFVGGKLLNPDGSAQPSAAPFYTLPVVFGALFLKGDYWGLTRYSPGHERMVDWISGACVLTKKETYQRVGGFDEKIFMYFEEVDLFFRARKQGLRVGFCPQAQFVHLGSASSGGTKSYPVIKVYQGFSYFYRKHHSKGAYFLLKFLLQLKGWIAILAGRLMGRHQLVATYEKALESLEMDR